MRTCRKIATLFANDITRQIEEVIKVDQTAEDIIAAEVDEYVVTDAIKRHFVEVLEKYQETPQKPHEGIAIWVSGFFGSGKSSFAKVLGLAIENRDVLGEPGLRPFSCTRTRDPKLAVVLKTINEKIPTHTVIFDVSTDRGIRSGNQMLTEIMYRLFLASLGYAKDIDLAELEIDAGSRRASLKGSRRPTRRRRTARRGTIGKARTMFALNEASRTLHKINPTTYPMADSWAKANVNRCRHQPRQAGRPDRRTLMKRRKPGNSLMFVVDEVGQFVARDIQKMLDLQAVVQQLGVKGRGKHWIVVTSQEKLNELVSGLDNRTIELAAPDGPLPAPGPPGAVGHLGGHQPARPGEEFGRRASPRARCSKRTADGSSRTRAIQCRHQAAGRSPDSPSSTSTRCCPTRSN